MERLYGFNPETADFWQGFSFNNETETHYNVKKPKGQPKNLQTTNTDAALLAKGGIDFNAANLNLQIKRDGRGVPLPLAQQDMAQLSKIQGFVPQIIEIKSAVNFPILSELQQKLQASSV